ncbi:MAG TPA: hypothetical protein VKU19_16840 [Bryobacteraceae bacterium]|nr:hypothetical protein [Bryobacteraceae bacterium]
MPSRHSCRDFWRRSPNPPPEVIVGNTKQGRLDHAAPQDPMHVPGLQAPSPVSSLLLRTTVSPAATISAATRAIREIDRQQPVVSPYP